MTRYILYMMDSFFLPRSSNSSSLLRTDFDVAVVVVVIIIISSFLIKLESYLDTCRIA